MAMMYQEMPPGACTESGESSIEDAFSRGHVVDRARAGAAVARRAAKAAAAAAVAACVCAVAAAGALLANRGSGAVAPRPSTASVAASSTLVTASLPAAVELADFYTCFGDDPIAWSEHKKEWCCAHKNRGCMTSLARYRPAGIEHYDCGAGILHWETGWSDPKKQWCCKVAGMGCVPWHQQHTWQIIIGVVAAAALLVGGYFLYKWYTKPPPGKPAAKPKAEAKPNRLCTSCRVCS